MEAGKCEKVGKMCKKTCDMCEEEPEKSNYFRFSLTCNISSFLKKIINLFYIYHLQEAIHYLKDLQFWIKKLSSIYCFYLIVFG